MSRTTSKSFRLPNHVLGRLTHLATEVGGSQPQVLEDLINIATSNSDVRGLLKARAQARGLLDGIQQEYGPDAQVVVHDNGNGDVTLTINGEKPQDVEAVVVDVDGVPEELRIVTLYHREFGLRIQPRLPAGTYLDEPGETYPMSLSDLYPA